MRIVPDRPSVRKRLAAVMLVAFVPISASLGDQTGQQVDFAAQVRPILVAHCTACHGGVKQAGGLSFVYPNQVLPPEGWVVNPGDPEASLLVQRIIEKDKELRMPPGDHGPPLSAEEIAVIRRWIEQGAKWQRHWAFEKPVHQDLPAVAREDWPRTGVDRFVLARQESRGVAPSPDATPRRWLRRVTLDLTGLPPTLDEVRSFASEVDSKGEGAYVQAVDRLLASPRFGERWASVWLDLVRYADSEGLGQDRIRNIWAYRDWVIRAFNDDMPYDQFTIKQLAGDLLPGANPEDLIATACNRLTATNAEGGTDDEEFRVEAIIDRVHTTWQTWQGATFGCCQCHNHPYDPWRHEDYYRFAAFFNSSLDSDLNDDYPRFAAPIHPRDFARAAELDEKITGLSRSLWRQEYALLSNPSAWRLLTGLEADATKSTRVKVERSGDHDQFVTVGTVARDTDITLQAPLPDGLERLTALRVSILPHNPSKALSDSEWGFILSHLKAELLDAQGKKLRDVNFAHVLSDSPDNYYPPNSSLDAKSKQGWGAFSRINHPRQCALVLSAPLDVPPGAKIRVVLQHRVFYLYAFSLVSRRGHLAVSDDHRFVELLTDEGWLDARRQLADAQGKRGKIRSTLTPVMRERPKHLDRPSHVFIRGLFLDKGDRVSPGVPASFEQLDEGTPADRLAMARWIASRDNPLTARVAVNRYWARLFGVGLVATEEDFGSSGEAPTHPKLLDYLSRQFMDQYDWSTKRLLREIVLSRTYRQSGKARQDLSKSDPVNQLLAQGPHFRLSSEMVRDQALAISGLLSDKQFGPPVYPPLPNGAWRPFEKKEKWNIPAPGDPNRYRRAIYTYTKRSIPYPLFATFDAPSREFCTPRRLRSNTPLQALMTMNDEAFVEMAAALADRMAQAASDVRGQIAYGVELATCRPATPREIDTLLALYAEYDSPEKSRQMVADVLLNLDELFVK